jgi:perosamine synthetase
MRPFFTDQDTEEIADEIKEILKLGSLTLGPKTRQFESEFSHYVGTRFAIGVNSGTSALEIVYRFLDIRNKEVITPTNTHIATSNAVLFAGGKPVLADTDPSNLCVDVDDVRSKVTKKTAAVVVVHIAGLIHPRILELQKLCDEENLFLIEDAAHAQGATAYGKKAGSFGNAGTFSFYPAKVMTTGEGGIIVTNDEKLAEIAKILRNHGTDPSTSLQVTLGYNWRMQEISAIIGLHQLRLLERILEERNTIARIYRSRLSNIEGVKPIEVPENFRNSYYKFPVILGRDVDSNRVKKIMTEEFGIEIGNIYYPPCHLQPVYKKLLGYREGILPASEDILPRTITIPIYVGLTEDVIDYIVSSLEKAVVSSEIKSAKIAR